MDRVGVTHGHDQRLPALLHRAELRATGPALVQALNALLAEGPDAAPLPVDEAAEPSSPPGGG